MRKPSAKPSEPAEFRDDVAFKQQYGKIASCLMLAGVVVPTTVFLVSFAITGGGERDVIFSACFALCVLLELAAFVCGVISWPNIYAKTTVVTIAAVALLVLLYMVLCPLLVVPEHNLQAL